MTIEEKAIHDYGITNHPEFAGYMLTDGRMLNFSYEMNQRDQDHRNIGFYFKKSKYESPGDNSIYMYKFMKRGNIRVKCNDKYYGFEYVKLPTYEQMLELKTHAQYAYKNHIDFCIETYTKRRKHLVFHTFHEFCNHIEQYVHYNIPYTLF